MARLFEYIGKQILSDFKLAIPQGKAVNSLTEAQRLASKIGFPLAVKGQVYTTKRKDLGLIKFAKDKTQLNTIVRGMLGKKVGNYTVEKLLIEKKLAIKQEFYLGFIIDDKAKALRLLLASRGGSGIEEIVAKHPDCFVSQLVDTQKGLAQYEVANLLRKISIKGKLQRQLAAAAISLYRAGKSVEARSAEINPLVLTEDEKIVAADCRFAIDDYAVFRQPQLDIAIARELDRPPTELEKIAFAVEDGDYRGTFYFIQLEDKFKKKEQVVGFHGAGGGGSMMSMDALLGAGFKIANFTDTSGNPPASKVYRAAKIILSQVGIVGYFGSGSGVASQEQYHSARGLVKAFLEEDLNIPAVIRLGGNSEDLAVEILTKYTSSLAQPVLGFKKDDSPEFCAAELKKLIANNKKKTSRKKKPVRKVKGDCSFATLTGKISWQSKSCKKCQTKACIASCRYGILKLNKDVPTLAISKEDAKRGQCIECLACELACQFAGENCLNIELPIAGLNKYRQKIGKK